MASVAAIMLTCLAPAAEEAGIRWGHVEQIVRVIYVKGDSRVRVDEKESMIL